MKDARDDILERFVGFGVNLAILVAVTAIGGLAMWGMWAFVAHARETWSYFPRGMYIIPAGVTVVYVGVVLGLAKVCISALGGKAVGWVAGAVLALFLILKVVL